MRILSWNVNGIRAGHRKGFLDWLAIDSPDILGLQETKAHSDQLVDELRNPDGYYASWHLGERKGYSGVGILSKEKPLEVVTDFGTNSLLSKEGRTIMADFGKFKFINCYFPNGKKNKERLDYKMQFYKEFLEYVNKLSEDGSKVIFCGDVNTAHTEIDLARPKGNQKTSGFLPIEREWIDSVIESGYIDTFREFVSDGEKYSWWDMKTRARDRNVGWRIDYVYVSSSLKSNLKDAFILNDIMGSDHCPVGVEIKL